MNIPFSLTFLTHYFYAHLTVFVLISTFTLHRWKITWNMKNDLNLIFHLFALSYHRQIRYYLTSSHSQTPRTTSPFYYKSASYTNNRPTPRVNISKPKNTQPTLHPKHNYSKPPWYISFPRFYPNYSPQHFENHHIWINRNLNNPIDEDSTFTLTTPVCHRVHRNAFTLTRPVCHCVNRHAFTVISLS